jgi:hypothetical protein
VTKRRVGIGALVAAALVLSLGRWASEQYTDSLWYAALGASDVWRDRFVNGMALRVGSFLFASAFAFVNLYAVRQSVVSLVLPRRIANIEIGEEVPGRPRSSRASAARSARPIPSSAPISASSSTGCPSRRSSTTGRCCCCSSSSASSSSSTR